MIDFGKHTTEVLLAYGVSIAMIIALVVWSFAQSKRAKKQLSAAEKQHQKR